MGAPVLRQDQLQQPVLLNPARLAVRWAAQSAAMPSSGSRPGCGEVLRARIAHWGAREVTMQGLLQGQCSGRDLLVRHLDGTLCMFSWRVQLFGSCSSSAIEWHACTASGDHQRQQKLCSCLLAALIVCAERVPSTPCFVLQCFM